MDGLSQIYDLRKENEERFLIKNASPRCGKVFYLDEDEHEEKVVEQPTSLDIEDFRLTGGAAKRKTTKKEAERVLYPSMNDINDDSIQEFLKVCHLDYLTANHKSNSVFIVPTPEALKKIKADIKKQLGSTKPDSPEGVAMIKSMNLIYKAFILDVFGKTEKNANFDYRLPAEYPEKFNADVIYRRTSRYEDTAFFIKLDKKGAKVSANSDMSNAVSVSYIDSVGRYPSYVSFVFKGDILPLLDAKAKVKEVHKRKTKKLFADLLQENADYEEAAVKFTAAMIKKYGVEKCKPYYSANLLQSSFAMISAFGAEPELEECLNYGDMHAAMLKAYRPISYGSLSSSNISKIANFGERFLENMESYMSSRDYTKSAQYNSSRYFSQLKNGYSQISKGNAEFVANEIAADIAYGIYDETTNGELAIASLNKIKKAVLNDKPITNFELKNYISYLGNSTLKGLVAQRDFPMLATSAALSFQTMNGGDAEQEDELSFKMEFGDDEEPKEPEDLEISEEAEEEAKEE